MAFRIGGRVVCGEIINTSANSVHGWLGLRDVEQPVALQLTGNLGPEMAGRHVRFEVRDEAPSFDSRAPDVDISDFAMQQIGPTGTMTIRKVKVPTCSVEEFYQHSKLGEPLPVEWKDSLYLEWFSQNGRVVLELVDPKVEYVDQLPSEEGDQSASDSTAEDDAQSPDEPRPPIRFTEDPAEIVERWENAREAEEADEEEDEDEDPYGLFPKDLQSHLDSESTAADRAISPLDEDDPFVQQMMLMDELIENGEDVPVSNIFDPPIKLYAADRLDDEQVEQSLKMLLARLALHGIALDMCEHYTPRRAYKLLMETILKEEGTFPELPQTGFVQHFMTHEFCDECDAEMDREFEEYEKRRESKPADDDPAEDEPPWVDDSE